MKKLNVAIIGQGRSGYGIHGNYFLSERNDLYTVKYIVDPDPVRQKAAEKSFSGCKILSSHSELYDLPDLDLAVNATPSDLHASVTRDLLSHGINVLVEKPFGKSESECSYLIELAKEKGVTLAVFQQSFFAPYYLFVKKIKEEKKLGDILQANVCFNGFARRWDWQTLQKRCAGGLYNTGPHPVGIALGILDFDKDVKLEYSRLGKALTSGDADDYAKLILSSKGVTVDVEVISSDAYSDYNVKLIGTRGTLKCKIGSYELTYIKEGENPERSVIDAPLRDEKGEPIYCSEELIKHTESGTFEGTAFDKGTAELYRQLYFKITEGVPMTVTAEMARDIIRVIEEAHAKNPLPIKYL